MKRLIQQLVLAAACACAAGYFLLLGQRDLTAVAQSSAGARQLNQCGQQSAGEGDAYLALCDPDKFAWQLFVKITRPLPTPAPSPDSVPVLWETWATDDETFPKNPSPANPPKWPGDLPRPKRLRPITQQVVLEKLSRPILVPGIQFDVNSLTNGEEVQRNRAAFDYIVRNKLYYVEGLNDAFNRGFVVNFPQDAIEVKPVWIPFTDGKGNKIPLKNPVTGATFTANGRPVYPDPSRYHTHTATVQDGSGSQVKVQFGLVALHVMSKDTPNWTWQTFEQVDNPGRCDYIGCHDDFGAVPADVAPNVRNGQYTSYAVQYAGDRQSPALQQMFKAAGITQEWTYYRLKGSQNNFTDPTGQPQRVGNSVTEAGFVQTSSCMTCHARSAIAPGSATAATTLTAAEALVFDPTVNSHSPCAVGQSDPKTPFNAHTLTVFNQDVLIGGNQQSFYGPVPASWFYQDQINPLSSTASAPPRRTYMQTDFVWAFFKACPAGPAK